MLQAFVRKECCPEFILRVLLQRECLEGWKVSEQLQVIVEQIGMMKVLGFAIMVLSRSETPRWINET